MRKAASKRINLFFSAILLLILHFPLLSAHHKPYTVNNPQSVQLDAILPCDSIPCNKNEDVLNTANSLYETMRLDLAGLSKKTFDYAMKGFNYLLQSGKLENGNIISIADFSMPSSRKRLFVIDLQQAKLLFNTYVAHGINSGAAMANNFSNQPESNKSSLGFYETLNTYMGGHGYSLRLEGLEKGINDNANSRDIVIHAADYVDEGFIKTKGFLGRSWGCPALPEKLSKPIINKIKDGTCLFIYSPDKTYLNRSKIINA